MISVASIIRNSAAGLGERSKPGDPGYTKLFSKELKKRLGQGDMEDVMPLIYSVEVTITRSEKFKSFQYVLGPGAGKGPAQKSVLDYLTRTYPAVNIKDIHIELKEAGRLLLK